MSHPLIGSQVRDCLPSGWPDTDDSDRVDSCDDDDSSETVEDDGEDCPFTAEDQLEELGYQLKKDEACIGLFTILVDDIRWNAADEPYSRTVLQAISSTMDSDGVLSALYPLGAVVARGDLAMTDELRARHRAASGIERIPSLKGHEVGLFSLLSLSQSSSVLIVRTSRLAIRFSVAWAGSMCARCSTSTSLPMSIKASVEAPGDV